MKILLSVITLLTLTCILSASCAHAEAPIDLATVNTPHASLRSRDSSTSRTLKVLEPGDHVEIMEQQGRWYRVRQGEIQGWMEVTSLLTDSVRDRIQENVNAALIQVPQNTGVLRQDGNLRLEPGRSTSVLRRLPARTPVEVLERRTLPREDSPERLEAWLKVRSSPTEVGWLLGAFVEFDIPEEISQYTEEYTYSAVQTLQKVEDPVLGPVSWYVVGERRPGADPTLDFTGIRVFTWNEGRHRYETAYRKRDLRGVYPLEIGKNTGKPTFRFYELSADGSTAQPRDFEMNGVVVREIKKPNG